MAGAPPTTNENERDGAAVRFPPPLVYLLAGIVGVLLQAFVLPLPLGPPRRPRITLALAAAPLGVARARARLGPFRRTWRDPARGRSTPESVSTGVYRLARNPRCVGVGLIQTAFGRGWASGWILRVRAGVPAVTYAGAIRHEE